jgi:hypothetical protein
MTATEQIRRITAALAECNRFIAIESARSADLRPAETPQLLNCYLAQRNNLQSQMANLWQQVAA